MRFFIGIFAKSNIQKQESYYQESAGDLSVGSNINKIHFSKTPSILTTASRNSIPKNTSSVNVKRPLKDNILVKLGIINATPNHPAEILLKTAENARSQDLVKKISINQLYDTTKT